MKKLLKLQIEEIESAQALVLSANELISEN